MRLSTLFRRLFALAFLAATLTAASIGSAHGAVMLAPVLQGLSSPLYVTSAHDGTNRLFVVEQEGTIKVLLPSATAPAPFLDITSKVLFGGERGLLGLAFHPQFATNSRFFVNYTRQPDGATVIAEYRAMADPVATAASERVFLVIAQPYANHNGGMIEFGPDGFLYIGMGDGGSGNDPENRAQNINALLGKILRIDVDHPADPNLYSSPPGNPYAGATAGRDEIFAVGMRNPFRFSFDRGGTRALYVGDVGQDAVEEIDIVTGGGNYGWRVYEGNACTNLDPTLCTPANFVPPIAEYGHTGERCSVTGGYVYRGSAGALPLGTYVFGDFCSGEIFSLQGGTSNLLLDTGLNISSFGEDEAGEIYVVGLGGTVHRITVVDPRETTTTLAGPPGPVTVGTPITFTATVVGTNPSGSVTFSENGVALTGCSDVALTGSGNSRMALCTVSNLALGIHSIIANYSGSSANTASSSPPFSQVITVPPTATASFVGSDTATQGNWKDNYGSDGYAVFGDTTAYPAYAAATPSGKFDYTWAAQSTDARALQRAASGRIAACWYSASSFELDLNLTDGASHRVALYLLDWDNNNRATRVEVLDAATQQVLATQSVQSYQGGVYLVWKVQGHVRLRFTNVGGANAVLSGIFFDANAPVPPTATVSFVGSDTATQGNWKGNYGSDGYAVFGDTTTYPAYAAATPSGKFDFTWAAQSTDARALQRAASGRIAACWYSASSFELDLNLTDGASHRVALYLLDWDNNNRATRVEVLDAATQQVLATQSVQSYQAGVYLVWKVQGHVRLRFTNVGGANAVLSGIFFDANAPVPPTATASFVGSDTATQGNWKGNYGSDGYAVFGDTTTYPAYAAATPSGKFDYTWAAQSTDARALQRAASGRIAACWYSASSFELDLNLTDGASHRVALYLLDWDNNNRATRVEVLDAATQQVLATQSVQSYQAGVYLVWKVQGHVRLRLTNVGGANAVLSGIFFDPTTAAPPVATSTLLVGAPNPAVAGASVTLTASVSGNAPSGSVSFTENGNPIGCAAATLAVGNPSSGSCSLSSLAVGTHSIVASYSGDPANLASTSPVLSQAITAPTASCAPEIVIDNLPPGAAGSSGVGEVSFTGNWAQSGASGGYGDNGSLYSFDDVSVPDAYTWRTPVLSSTQSCTYAVYVWWTTHPNRSVSVPITVSGQTSAPSTQSYNQQLNGSQWVLHGSYTFAPGARASVQVTNAGGQAAADAVRFVLDGSVGNLSSWNMFGREPQHTAVSPTASQPLNRIHWQTPVDLQPQYTGNRLFIHYGSPLVTSANTVIVPVKTGATDGFRVEARAGSGGALIWSMATDYILPQHSWVPAFGPALTSQPRLYFPGAGGIVYFRDQPDTSTGASGQIAFYGLSNYLADTAAYNAAVMINTPLVTDPSGNVYFGFQVTGSTPLGLTSGIARISAGGQGTWTPVTTASGDSTMTKVPHNSAPALSADFATLYVAVSNGLNGYLVALDSTTLAPAARVRLTDPKSGLDAGLSDNSTASPTVGTDGDVYFGVLESPSGENDFRGWLLHFDSSLSQSKTPGAFGWDDTVSLVAAQMVPSYQGPSAYLLMAKYNSYSNGLHRIAVLDPNATQTDPVTLVTAMKEVLTMLGPTPDPNGGVKEWCINSAAVDPLTKSILANSEDGKLYRWNLTTNTLSQTVVLTAGLGEAYTSTVIGVDGQVYAINNATLFAAGQ